jgi:hypothetical protein
MFFSVALIVLMACFCYNKQQLIHIRLSFQNFVPKLSGTRSNFRNNRLMGYTLFVPRLFTMAFRVPRSCSSIPSFRELGDYGPANAPYAAWQWQGGCPRTWQQQHCPGQQRSPAGAARSWKPAREPDAPWRQRGRPRARQRGRPRARQQQHRRGQHSRMQESSQSRGRY